MKGMKNIVLSILTTFSCLSLLIQPSLAKYSKTENGTLCELVFSDYNIVEDVFKVENSEGETSKSLWGAGSLTGGANSSNYLDSLSDKAFFIKNDSGKRMKFYLEIGFYLNLVNGTSSLEATAFKVGNSNEYYCTLVSSNSTNPGDITYSRSNYVSGGGFLDYGYECKATIDPAKLVKKDASNNKTLISTSEMEESFVVNNGETTALHFSILYEASGIDINLYSKYITVQLRAEPYPA